jgi:hypothetical protein
MEKGKRIIADISSWNPEIVERATGYRINPHSEKSYFVFATELGNLKDTKNMVGEVYTYFTPLNGLTNNALLSADVIFERGTAKFYLRMVKDRTPNWDFRAAELYDQGGYNFRLFYTFKGEPLPGGGYRAVPLP